MNSTRRVAEHLASAQFGDIPEADILVSKMHLVDTLGVMIAGTCDQSTRAVMNYACSFGGRQEASAIGFGERLPAPLAGMVNAVAARAFDLDDCHEGNATHTSVAVVPTALAMAERNPPVSGKNLLTAVTLGNDLISRISSGAKRPGNVTGWAPSMVCGTFGAAATAGRILDLDADAMVRALGLALMRTSGTFQYTRDNGAYQVNFGFLVESGIAAAILAAQGVFYALDVFEGDRGYYPIYQLGEYDIGKLLSGLGEQYEGSYVSFKPYPTCKHTHTSITAALTLAKKHDLQPEDIASIRVRGNHSTEEMSRDPLKVEFDPGNRYEARAGLEKLIGVAIVKRKVFLEDVTEAALTDSATLEKIRSVSTKVKIETDPELEREFGRGIGPSIMEVKTNDGRRLEERIDFVKGHPLNPMSYDEIEQKFRACLPFAARPVDRGRAEDALQMIRHLENLEDASVLPGLLT